jgi:type II secretory pathway predicted ATPase ExeA
LAAAFLVNPTLNRDEFLETLLERFEITCASTGRAARIVALHKMLLELRERDGTAVLVIDEAHLLSTEILEEVRILSNIESNDERLIQIVLSGQPELHSLLCRPEWCALQRRIAAAAQLSGFNAAQTGAYIAERLGAGGHSGPTPFPNATIEALHKYSQGIPRLINLLCETCLSIGFVQGTEQIEPEAVEDAARALDLLENLLGTKKERTAAIVETEAQVDRE